MGSLYDLPEQTTGRESVPEGGFRRQPTPETMVHRDPVAPVTPEVPEAPVSHIALHTPEGQPVTISVESQVTPAAAPVPVKPVGVVVPGVDDLAKPTETKVETPEAPNPEGSSAYQKALRTDDAETLAIAEGANIIRGDKDE